MRRNYSRPATRQQMLTWAGRTPNKRFATTMANFRDQIAEVVASSRPVMTVQMSRSKNDDRAKMHKKIITKLRANGYRPLGGLDAS